MIIVIIATLTLYCSAVLAQSPSSIVKKLPPELQQKYLQNERRLSNLNEKEAMQLLQKEIGSKTQAEKADTTLRADTTKLKKIAIEGDTFTVYEKIVRGDIIHPDSFLSKLPIFGHEIFSRAQPSTFAPTDNISIPSNYIVNMGDEIIILLWGRINEEYRLKVERDGAINIPRIGPVSVAGLTFNNLKENLLTRLEQIEGVKASISIGTMRTIGVYIVGEVKTPGFYTISALSNVTNALFYAGGPSKNGSLRNIHLKRNKELIAAIDLYDFLLEGNDRSSLRLQAGDVIHVPVLKKLVAVLGNVRRPAFYELKGNETLDEVISLAGGLTPSAWINTIQIERFTDNNRHQIIDIDSIRQKIPSIPVCDGDVIKIFPILEKNYNAIFLSGNVVRPGKYELKNRMRISDILPDYRSLLPETYLDYAIVIRQDPPKYLNRIQAFNLKNAIEDKSSEDNLLLQERDHIIIYNLDYFEPDRAVEIGGSVTSPGRYKLLVDMKIRDIILQAGGLRDDASNTRGELYRREFNPQSDSVTVKKIDFCVECAMKDDPHHNLLLTRLDRIFIRNKLGWEPERKVTLRGQFNYPGTYILFEGEKLGELIERAGGYKADAYLPAAVFTRTSVKQKEQEYLEEYGRQIDAEIFRLTSEISAKKNAEEAQVLLEQQEALKRSLMSMRLSGRIVIDLTDEKRAAEFPLEDGDDIFVPRKLNTVSVMGEVYNPSTFTFNADYNTSYYLESAGGAKPNSDLRKIYIIKANGNIITNKNIKILKAKLEPGDAVVVPQKIRYSNPHKIFVDTVDTIFKISSLLATLATLLVAINSM